MCAYKSCQAVLMLLFCHALADLRLVCQGLYIASVSLFSSPYSTSSNVETNDNIEQFFLHFKN